MDDLPEFESERRGRRSLLALGIGAVAAAAVTSPVRASTVLDSQLSSIVLDPSSRTGRAFSKRFVPAASVGVADGVAGLGPDGGILTADGSPVQSRTDQDIATLVATSGRFPGLDPTGEQDSSSALNEAIADLPEGATLVIPPGRYRVDSAIENNGADGSPKTIRISGYGATIVQSGSDPTFRFRGRLGETRDVDGVQKTTVRTEGLSENAEPVDGIELRLAGVLPDGEQWRRGDIVKLVADDPAVGARYADADEGNAKRGADGRRLYSRVGQFLSVYSVDGRTVVLLGVLRDSFTESVRVARVERVTTELSGLTIDVADGILGSADHAESHLVHYSLQAPVVSDVTILRGNGSGIVMTSCFGYSVDSVVVHSLQNAPAKGQYGYGVLDQASYGGVVDASVFRQVRHAYTAIPSYSAGGSDLFRYGRTYGAVVSDSICENPTSSAWSTHHGSDSVTFIGCTAVGARGGFGLRGRFHRILGGAVRDSGTAVGLRVDPNTGPGPESYGHVVDGLTVQNVDTVVSADVYSGQRLSYFRNIVATGISGQAVKLDRGNVAVSDSVFVFASRSEGDVSLFELVGRASLRLDRIDVDLSAWSEEKPDAVHVLDGGTRAVEQQLRASGLTVTAPEGVVTALARVQSECLLQADVSIDGAPTNGFGGLDAADGSWLDAEVTSTGARTDAVSAQGSDVTGRELLLRIARGRSRSVTVVLDTQGEDRELGPLLPPRSLGEIVTIINAGSAGDAVLARTDQEALTIGPGRAVALRAVSMDGSPWFAVSAS